MKTMMIKASLTVICLAAGIACTGATAEANDSIKERVGVTGRLGFLLPAESETVAGPYNISTDVGFIGGGGFIYGITKNIALELDITHSDFDSDVTGAPFGNFETINLSFGAQYRFNNPMEHLTPYVGGGLDILFNEFTSHNGLKGDVDTVPGIHFNAGVDYFMTKRVALNGEVKMVVAPDADLKIAGKHAANFDPMSSAMTFGVRYFFN